MALKKSDITIQVEKEHECFKRDLRDIETDVMKEVSAEDFTDWHIGIIWRLRDFRTHVLKHIDLEEEGGFMKEIVTEAPEAIGEVEKFEKEHGQIVSDLDGILVSLKKMEKKDNEKLADIRTRVTELISKILAHEDAENNLIQKVYCCDYGYPS